MNVKKFAKRSGPTWSLLTKKSEGSPSGINWCDQRKQKTATTTSAGVSDLTTSPALPDLAMRHQEAVAAPEKYTNCQPKGSKNPW